MVILNAGLLPPQCPASQPTGYGFSMPGVPQAEVHPQPWVSQTPPLPEGVRLCVGLLQRGACCLDLHGCRFAVGQPSAPDCIMAVWGSPLPMPTPGLCALKAVIDIRARAQLSANLSEIGWSAHREPTLPGPEGIASCSVSIIRTIQKS